MKAFLLAKNSLNGGVPISCPGMLVICRYKEGYPLTLYNNYTGFLALSQELSVSNPKVCLCL